MTVPLETAKASKSALMAKASTLFSAVQDNVVIHDKSHWNRENAHAALTDKPQCGYYCRIRTEKWLSHKKNVEDNKPLEPMSRKAAKNWEPFTKTFLLPVDGQDCLNIIHAVLGCTVGVEYKISTHRPEERFVLVAPMPKGYGGETLHRDSAPEKCAYVGVVIVAGLATNTAIVTHFPCAASWFDVQDALT